MGLVSQPGEKNGGRRGVEGSTVLFPRRLLPLHPPEGISRAIIISDNFSCFSPSFYYRNDFPDESILSSFHSPRRPYSYSYTHSLQYRAKTTLT
jgi:hypothetical protein